LEFNDYRQRQVLSRLGTINVSRAYYHCERGHSACPLDELLGIQEHGILPELQQIVAEQSARLPYAEAVSGIERMLPVSLAVSTGELVTATVAARVQQEQRRELDEAFGDPAMARLPEAEQDHTGAYAVIAADGGMCRIKGQEEYSEFKVGVLGTVTPGASPEDGPQVLDKSYVAHLGDCDQIFQHIQLEFSRKGLDKCSLVQFLGDGADWIWNRAPLLRQPGQELLLTLDFFHAMEYVQKAAAVVFPDTGTDDAKKWVHAMATRLKKGKLKRFFTELEVHRSARPATEGEDALGDVLRYFTDRKKLLTYKRCQELGLPIGSGMVEGGVRFVGKDRLHRTGMAWTVPGAEAVLQLRALQASNRWDPFFKKHAVTRMAAYRDCMSLRLRAA
jgi:hypothetical protein